MPERRVVVHVRLSPAGLREVDALAEADERSRSEMIRKLLAEAVAARKVKR